MFVILKDIFAVVGLILTIEGIYDLYHRWAAHKIERRELSRKIALLRGADHFIAHIIQLGGESSMIYSMAVRCSDGGGYYFNPAKEFVSVGFSRAGLMVVSAADLPAKEGFGIDSIAGADGNFVKHDDSRICHFSLPSARNECLVKFARMRI
jgi:hypothetical protein